jgi:uncharacterized Ntn-hydrolase superfamily protein
MTFCTLGYCPDTDQVGIGYTTVTLAGGGISPFYSYNGDIVVVQAYGNQAAAIIGARALDEGCDAESASDRMQSFDNDYEYRQVGIMQRNGTPFARTGSKVRPWAGHIVGDDFIAMGNVLVGSEVVAAMASAFSEAHGQPLAERLLLAIESGREAGGQLAPGDRRYDERSALLRVIGDGEQRRFATALDLRVDMCSDAVTELRRVYEIYKPVIKRRSERASAPERDPPTIDWERDHMAHNPPPDPIR